MAIARLVIAIALLQASLVSFGATKASKAKAFLVYVDQFKLDPGNVIGGNSVTGTIKLNENAPTGGAAVSLSSNKSQAIVPSSVTVPEGSSSATFTITTSATASDVVATLTAKLGANWKDANLIVSRPGVKDVTVSPGSIMLGQSATGTVTLTGPAPGGNVSVTMTAGDKLDVPGLVWVSAGSTTATFPITTRVGSDNATYAINAALNGTQKSVVFKIVPTQLADLQISPTSVDTSAMATGTVTLGAYAPSEGAAVQLNSSSQNITFSHDLIVPSNSKYNTFTIQTYVGDTATTATITAKYRDITKTATLKIAKALPVDFTAASTTVKSGPTSYVTLYVSISGMACASDVRVPVTSSNSNVISVGDLIVKHKSTKSAPANIRVGYVSKPTVVTLTAKLNGIILTLDITVNPQ